jgi:hypothetical protein
LSVMAGGKERRISSRHLKPLQTPSNQFSKIDRKA